MIKNLRIRDESTDSFSKENISTMKKILMLGGAYSQIPAIKAAKDAGYYVITCDYLPDNPGHKFSDAYYNVSTTDLEGVLAIAKKEQVDGVIAYASDPSAQAAAYAADELGLPGAGFEATKMLSEKDLFRAFLRDSGFNTPWFRHLTSLEDGVALAGLIEYPCVVKPVDSSGSKGVTVVNDRDEYLNAINGAFGYTRCGRVIVEEYIDSPYDQLHGDGIVVDGELAFLELGDQRFFGAAPVGTSFPSAVPKEYMENALREVAGAVRKSGMRSGGINVEARVKEDGTVFIIEIGPRSGGNYVPQTMQLATGVDEVDNLIRIAMGRETDTERRQDIRCCMQYVIGSERGGTFTGMELDEFIRPKIRELYLHKKPGDQIVRYGNSGAVVGVALVEFDSMEEMERIIPEMKTHIVVGLRD